MIVYFSKSITARAWRSRVETIDCEKCRCRYRYLLVRGATASASAPYGLGVQSAHDRATSQANSKAARRLAHGVDPVACPDCGWFQPAMITEIRRRRTAWLHTAAIGASVSLAVVTLIYFLSETSGLKHGFDRMTSVGILGLEALGASVVLVPAGFYAWGWFIRSQLQPNEPNADHSIETRDAPVCARVGPDGQNDAAVELDPEEATSTGRLGYERGYGEKFPGGWMTVQLASLASPPVCSICMQFCQSTRRIGSLKLPIAVCPSCKARSVWKTVLMAVAVLALYGIAAAAYIYPMSHREREDKGVLVCVLAVILAVASLIVINRVTQPMRTRRRSVERNTVAVRFSRRPFAEQFFALNRRRSRELLDQQSIPLAIPVTPPQPARQV